MPNRSSRRRQASSKKKSRRGASGKRSDPTVSEQHTEPSPSTPSQKAETGSRLYSIMGWRPQYIMDIITELRKVTWPSRGDTIHLTIVVVVVSVIIGAMLGGIDFGFGWIIDKTLLR